MRWGRSGKCERLWKWVRDNRGRIKVSKRAQIMTMTEYAENGSANEEHNVELILNNLYPKAPIAIDHLDLIAGARKVVAHFFPSWNQEILTFKQFTSGITNKLMYCDSKETEECILIRIYGKNSEILIDRNQELVNLYRLSSLKLCPKLHGRFLNGIVYGFIPGTPFEVSDMSEPSLSQNVASTLACWHKVAIPGERKPLLFHTIQRWISSIPQKYTVPEKNEKFDSSFDLAQLQAELEFLKKTLIPINSPCIFSHNDLLSGNIIYDQELDKISFIDYEYACYNYRGFDLGNHFCEFAGFDCNYSKYPEREFQLKWLSAYLKSAKGGDEPSEEEIENLYLEVNKFAAAAHYFWTIWSLVQGEISDIDFDYLGYAALRFQEYQKLKEKFLL